MSDNSNFSDSDGGDLIKELEKLDDLDGDLFGSSPRKTADTQRQDEPKDGSSELETSKKPDDDFDDDDDPLADLLAEETNQRTKSLLKQSAAFSGIVEEKLEPKQEPKSEPSKPPLRRQKSFIREDSETKPTDRGRHDITPESSENKQPPKKSSLDFDDEDILGSLDFDNKEPKSQPVTSESRAKKPPQRKPSLDFGDEDILGSLDFDSKEPKLKPITSESRAKKPPQRKPSLDFGDEDILGSLDLDSKEQKEQPVTSESRAKKPPQRKPSLDFGDEDILGSLDLDSKEQPVTSESRAKKPPQRKPSLDFGDEDILGSLDLSGKETKESPTASKAARMSPKKTEIDFGDDDLLDDLGFGGKPKASATERPTAGRRGLSFMDDLMGGGKKPDSPKREFQLGSQYKNVPAKDEGLAGYNPSTGTGSVAPRRRRGMDETSPSSPKPRTPRTMDSIFDDPSPASLGAEQRPTTGRRPASSPKTDWLGVSDEAESPKKKPGSGRDWLEGSTDVRSSKTEKGGEEGMDWLQLKKNLKPKEESAPAATPKPPEPSPIVTVARPPQSPDPNPIVTVAPPTRETTVQVAPPPIQQPVISPSLVADIQGSVAKETADLVANLKALIASAQIEKQQTANTIETLTKRHKEELDSSEQFYKNQIKVIEDHHKETEKRYLGDQTSRNQELQETISRLEKEKSELALQHQELRERSERERKQEVDRLKDLHSQAILSLRQDHQDALNRLQRLKEQELHALASAQEHTRSVQQVMSELESKTYQLSLLQEKLEGQQKDALEERRAVLESKEQQLKVQEARYHRLYEESEVERARLQQLVMRLEKRLVDLTKDLEDEKWRVLQERGRLESRSQVLEEKKAEVEHLMTRDRNRLQQAKEMCLEEQRNVWLQVSQERQGLGDREASLRRKEEELNRMHRKRAQEEIRLESDQRVLQQERSRLEGERLRLHEEAAAIVREKETVQIQKNQLRDEMDKIAMMSSHLKRREQEMEKTLADASEKKEEGLLALANAKQLEISVREQKQKVALQTQTLHEKERKVIKERMSLLEEAQRLDNMRNSLICANCRLSYIRPLSVPSAEVGAGQPSHGPPLLSPANLFVWKLQSEKDKAFLDKENKYLESLKLLEE